MSVQSSSSTDADGADACDVTHRSGDLADSDAFSSSRETSPSSILLVLDRISQTLSLATHHKSLPVDSLSLAPARLVRPVEHREYPS